MGRIVPPSSIRAVFSGGYSHFWACHYVFSLVRIISGTRFVVDSDPVMTHLLPTASDVWSLVYSFEISVPYGCESEADVFYTHPFQLFICARYGSCQTVILTHFNERLLAPFIKIKILFGNLLRLSYGRISREMQGSPLTTFWQDWDIAARS